LTKMPSLSPRSGVVAGAAAPANRETATASPIDAIPIASHEALNTAIVILPNVAHPITLVFGVCVRTSGVTRDSGRVTSQRRSAVAQGHLQCEWQAGEHAN